MARLVKDRSSNVETDVGQQVKRRRSELGNLNGLMPPPAARHQTIPSKRLRSELSNTAGSDAGSSTKKKRRRRRRSGRDGEDSVQDSATRTTGSSPSSPVIGISAPTVLHPKLTELRHRTLSKQSLRDIEPEPAVDAVSTVGYSNAEEPTPMPKSTTFTNELPPELQQPRYPIRVEATQVSRPQIVSDILPVLRRTSSNNEQRSGSEAEPELVASERTNRCPFRIEAGCSLDFESKEAARVHAKSFHSSLLLCPVCLKKLSRKDKVKQHMLNAHSASDIAAASQRPQSTSFESELPLISTQEPRKVPTSHTKKEAIASPEYENEAEYAIDALAHAPVQPSAENEEKDNTVNHDTYEGEDMVDEPREHFRDQTESSDEHENKSEIDTARALDDGPMQVDSDVEQLPSRIRKTRVLPFPADKITELSRDRSKATKRRQRSSGSASSSHSLPARKRARTEETMTTSDEHMSVVELPMRSVSRRASASTADLIVVTMGNDSDTDNDEDHSTSENETPSKNAVSETAIVSEKPQGRNGTVDYQKHSKVARSSRREQHPASVASKKRQSSLDRYVVDAASVPSSSRPKFKPITVNVPPVPDDWLVSHTVPEPLDTLPSNITPKHSRFKLQRDKQSADDRRCYRCWMKPSRCDNVKPACSSCSRDKRNCQIYSMTRDAFQQEKQKRASVSAAKARPNASPRKPPRPRRAALSEPKIKDKILDDDELDEDGSESSDFRPRATTTARRGSKGRVSRESSEIDSSADNDSNTPRTAKSSHSKGDYSFRELTKMGKIGRLDAKEMQYLLTWRDSFCAEHEISAYSFNEMMEATSKNKSKWPYAFITKNEFMDEYCSQLPGRNLRTMLRFRERYFRNVERGDWSKADEKELEQLIKQYGQRWVQIGERMGRTADEVSQHWRHTMNYGKGKKRGNWSDEELLQLEEEIESFAASKSTTVDDPKLEAIIPWQAISEKLGTGRTAQQCSGRWYGYNSKKRQSEGSSRRTPYSDRLPSSSMTMSKTPSKMEQRLSGTQKSPKLNDIIKSQSRSNSTSTNGTSQSPSSHIDDSEADDEREPVESEDDDEVVTDAEAERERQYHVNKEDASEAERSSTGSEESTSARSEPDEDNDQANDSDTGHVERTDKVTTTESVTSDSGNDIVAVRQATPLTSSTAKPGRSRKDAGSASTRSTKLKSPSSTKSKGKPNVPSANASVKSTQGTPMKSKNPLAQSVSTSEDPSLSQAFAATQADSSQRTAGGRSVRSRVPDSVYERPSPNMSVRRRPQSSPMSKDGINGRSGNEDLAHHVHDTSKSPASFTSAQEHSQPVKYQEDPDEASTIDSGQSEAETSASEDDATPVESSMAAPRSSFWTAINSVVNKVIPYSQKVGPTNSQAAGKRHTIRTLANALDGTNDGDDSDEE